MLNYLTAMLIYGTFFLMWGISMVIMGDLANRNVIVDFNIPSIEAEYVE